MSDQFSDDLRDALRRRPNGPMHSHLPPQNLTAASLGFFRWVRGQLDLSNGRVTAFTDSLDDAVENRGKPTDDGEISESSRAFAEWAGAVSGTQDDAE